MKKFFVLFIVFLLMLSALPVNAGPGYEKLKEKKQFILKIIKWDLPRFFLAPVIKGAINIMNEKGSLKARFKSNEFDFILTKSEFIYSDISFRGVARTQPFEFALRLALVFQRVKHHEFPPLKEHLFQDFVSKGITRFDTHRIFEFLNSLRCWVEN